MIRHFSSWRNFYKWKMFLHQHKEIKAKVNPHEEVMIEGKRYSMSKAISLMYKLNKRKII